MTRQVGAAIAAVVVLEEIWLEDVTCKVVEGVVVDGDIVLLEEGLEVPKLEVVD